MLIAQETLVGRDSMMKYEKRFNRSAGRLVVAAVALAFALIPNATAQSQQEKGRRVNPHRQDSAQAEAQTGESALGAQDKLTLIETQEGATWFSNVIPKTKIIRFDVSENAKRF